MFLITNKDCIYVVVVPVTTETIASCHEKLWVSKTKQNNNNNYKLIILLFFAIAYGEHTESALPLVNLFDVLTVHNVYRF